MELGSDFACVDDELRESLRRRCADALYVTQDVAMALGLRYHLVRPHAATIVGVSRDVRGSIVLDLLVPLGGGGDTLLRAGDLAVGDQGAHRLRGALGGREPSYGMDVWAWLHLLYVSPTTGKPTIEVERVKAREGASA